MYWVSKQSCPFYRATGYVRIDKNFEHTVNNNCRALTWSSPGCWTVTTACQTTTTSGTTRDKRSIDYQIKIWNYNELSAILAQIRINSSRSRNHAVLDVHAYNAMTMRLLKKVHPKNCSAENTEWTNHTAPPVRKMHIFSSVGTAKEVQWLVQNLVLQFGTRKCVISSKYSHKRSNLTYLE